VSYSYYEVYTNAQRAFAGLGFPYGADEDAAYIISWLELLNLNGINLLSGVYPKLDNSFNGSLTNNKLVDQIDLQNRSCLMVGPGLVDFLIFNVNKNQKINIELINCPDPIFLIPLLYRSIKKNIFSKIINDENILAIIGKEKLFINPKIEKNKNSKIYINFSKKEFEESSKKDFINYTTIKKNLSLGLNPDEKDWNIVSNLAFRTYVPESETSREKGAGGGDAND